MREIKTTEEKRRDKVVHFLMDAQVCFSDLAIAPPPIRRWADSNLRQARVFCQAVEYGEELDEAA